MEVTNRDEVRVMSVAGMMGSTFDEVGFRANLEKNPDMMGCDSGTSDSGPFFPGVARPRMNRKAVKRDLTLMITEGVKRGIPVMIGSAGTCGADATVQWMADIAREIAVENDLHFKLAEIKTEITKEQLKGYMDKGKFHALEGVPEFKEEDLEDLTRCISVIGPDPYIEALKNDAQVIIAGRSTDASIYAAVPIMYGLDNGFAWHAGKVLECGTLPSVRDIHHGSMFAWVRKDSVSIEPGNTEMKVSPASMVSHTLYENSNPFRLVEPGGTMLTANSKYEQETERRVRITETEHEKTPYTIKLEGVKFEGYRRVVISTVTDPLVLRQFDKFMDESLTRARTKIQRGMGLSPEDYKLRYEVYGNPDDPNASRIGLMFDIVAKDPADADGIISNVWHTVLHYPIADWVGAQSHLALPFSPPDLCTQDNGKTFSFCINHVVEVDDPLETCRISYFDL